MAPAPSPLTCLPASIFSALIDPSTIIRYMAWDEALNGAWLQCQKAGPQVVPLTNGSL